jgi:hypothetical protein
MLQQLNKELEQEVYWLKLTSMKNEMHRIDSCGEPISIKDLINEETALDKPTVREYYTCQICLDVV